MSVINFPGGSGPRIDRDLVERAVRLKQRLVHFATRGPMAERYQQVFEEQGVDGTNFQEFVEFTDWFIFEWEGEDGARVLDEFAETEADLDDADRRVLEGWDDAFTDLFDVVEVRPEGFVLADAEGDRYFAVPTSLDASQMNVKPGMTLGTRIAPLGEVYLLSGAQEVYSSRDAARAALIEELEDEAGSWLYDAFVEHFGSDELVIPAEEVPARFEEFARFVVDSFRPEGEGGKTMRETMAEDGLPPLDPAIFEELEVEGAIDANVGILVDRVDGPAIVPWYDELRAYLGRGEGDEEATRERLVDLIEDPHVPAFAIRRLAAAGPDRFSRLIADALDEPDFDAERDLDDLLDDYKGGGEPENDLFEEDDLVFAEEIDDVRELAPDERPEGTVAAAAYEFLAETTAGLKPETADAHALNVSMLLYFAQESGYAAAEQIDEALLVDFLAVWYPRFWGDRTATGARQLLTTVGKFTSWLDAKRGTTIGRHFKTSVLPELKEHLPRVVKAAAALERPIPFGGGEDEDIAMALGLMLDSSELEAAEVGGFTVDSVEGTTVRVERRDEEEDGEEVFEVEVPATAAESLRPGDVLVAVLLPHGERWRVASVLAVHPPVASR